VLVAPAAHSNPVKREWNGLLPVGAVVALALLVFDATRQLPSMGAGRDPLQRAIVLAHGTPILTEAIEAEQVALAGGKVWAGNPLDAFSRGVQGEYLDWLAGAGSGRGALSSPQIRVVLVSRGSAADTLTATDAAFKPVFEDSGNVIYTRVASAASRSRTASRRSAPSASATTTAMTASRSSRTGSGG
jgi:hypothetical protein